MISHFSEGASGGVLACDVGGLAPVFADCLRTRRYRLVSAEIYDEPPAGLPPDPATGAPPTGKMLRRVAFLGGDVPEVKGLGSVPLPEGDGESITGVNLFAAGDYRGKDYSEADLADIGRNFALYSAGDDPAFPVPAVVGHSEDQSWLADTGLPAAGWVTACSAGGLGRPMRYSEGASSFDPAAPGVMGSGACSAAWSVPTAPGTWAVFSERVDDDSYLSDVVAEAIREALDDLASGADVPGEAMGVGSGPQPSAAGDGSAAPGTSALEGLEAFAEPTSRQRELASGLRAAAARQHDNAKFVTDHDNAAGRTAPPIRAARTFDTATYNRRTADEYDPTPPDQRLAEDGNDPGQQPQSDEGPEGDQKRQELLDRLSRAGVDVTSLQGLDLEGLMEMVRVADAKAGVPGGSLGEGGFDEPADAKEAREHYGHAMAYFEHARHHARRFGVEGAGGPGEMAEDDYLRGYDDINAAQRYDAPADQRNALNARGRERLIEKAMKGQGRLDMTPEEEATHHRQRLREDIAGDGGPADMAEPGVSPDGQKRLDDFGRAQQMEGQARVANRGGDQERADELFDRAGDLERTRRIGATPGMGNMDEPTQDQQQEAPGSIDEALEGIVTELQEMIDAGEISVPEAEAALERAADELCGDGGPPQGEMAEPDRHPNTHDIEADDTPMSSLPHAKHMIDENNNYNGTSSNDGHGQRHYGDSQYRADLYLTPQERRRLHLGRQGDMAEMTPQERLANLHATGEVGTSATQGHGHPEGLDPEGLADASGDRDPAQPAGWAHGRDRPFGKELADAMNSGTGGAREQSRQEGRPTDRPYFDSGGHSVTRQQQRLTDDQARDAGLMGEDEGPPSRAEEIAEQAARRLSNWKGKPAGHRLSIGREQIGDLPEEGLRRDTVADVTRTAANVTSQNAADDRQRRGLPRLDEEFADDAPPQNDLPPQQNDAPPDPAALDALQDGLEQAVAAGVISAEVAQAVLDAACEGCPDEDPSAPDYDSVESTPGEMAEGHPRGIDDLHKAAIDAAGSGDEDGYRRTRAQADRLTSSRIDQNAQKATKGTPLEGTFDDLRARGNYAERSDLPKDMKGHAVRANLKSRERDELYARGGGPEAAAADREVSDADRLRTMLRYRAADLGIDTEDHAEPHGRARDAGLGGAHAARFPFRDPYGRRLGGIDARGLRGRELHGATDEQLRRMMNAQGTRTPEREDYDEDDGHNDDARYAMQAGQFRYESGEEDRAQPEPYRREFGRRLQRYSKTGKPPAQEEGTIPDTLRRRGVEGYDEQDTYAAVMERRRRERASADAAPANAPDYVTLSRLARQRGRHADAEMLEKEARRHGQRFDEEPDDDDRPETPEQRQQRAQSRYADYWASINAVNAHPADGSPEMGALVDRAERLRGKHNIGRRSAEGPRERFFDERPTLLAEPRRAELRGGGRRMSNEDLRVIRDYEAMLRRQQAEPMAEDEADFEGRVRPADRSPEHQDRLDARRANRMVTGRSQGPYRPLPVDSTGRMDRGERQARGFGEDDLPNPGKDEEERLLRDELEQEKESYGRLKGKGGMSSLRRTHERGARRNVDSAAGRLTRHLNQRGDRHPDGGEYTADDFDERRYRMLMAKATGRMAEDDETNELGPGGTPARRPTDEELAAVNDANRAGWAREYGHTRGMLNPVGARRPFTPMPKGAQKQVQRDLFGTYAGPRERRAAGQPPARHAEDAVSIFTQPPRRRFAEDATSEGLRREREMRRDMEASRQADYAAGMSRRQQSDLGNRKSAADELDAGWSRKAVRQGMSPYHATHANFTENHDHQAHGGDMNQQDIQTIDRAIAQGIARAVPGILKQLTAGTAASSKEAVQKAAEAQASLQKFAEEQKNAVDTAGVEKVLDELGLDGKVWPAERADELQTIMALDNTAVRKFSEGDKTVEMTDRAKYIARLKARRSRFGPHMADGAAGTAGGEAPDAEVAKVEAHYESFAEDGAWGKGLRSHTSKDEFVGAFKARRKREPLTTAESFLNPRGK